MVGDLGTFLESCGDRSRCGNLVDGSRLESLAIRTVEAGFRIARHPPRTLSMSDLAIWHSLMNRFGSLSEKGVDGGGTRSASGITGSSHKTVVHRASDICLPHSQRPTCDLVRWNCLPPRSTVLPLIVRELLDASAIKAHHENLTVRLRRIRVRCFILEAHP